MNEYIHFKSSTFIIIPVYNRKLITLKCLENLKQVESLLCYQVVVVDDGSTDGTQLAIKALYPEVVVLSGDGNLWWTGAIKCGMEYAIDHGADYLFWLNDDCLPQPGAIETLLNVAKKSAQTIVGGQSLDPKSLEPSYGGVVLRRGKIQPINAPSDGFIECEGLNGNLVCFSKDVVQAIGYPDERRFPQYHGDTAYTHQAKTRGYKLVIAGKAIAYCQNDHDYLPSLAYWLKTDASPQRLWQELLMVKSAHYWKAELGLYREFFGVAGFWYYTRDRLLRFLAITLMVLVLPVKLRLKLMPLFTRLKAARDG